MSCNSSGGEQNLGFTHLSKNYVAVACVGAIGHAAVWARGDGRLAGRMSTGKDGIVVLVLPRRS